MIPGKREGEPPPPPPPAAAGKPAAETPAPRHKESIKETVESIIIAFILAFVFRAFVVEAFVIPTGSMATTLLGAHMRFRCTDCGYQFDLNFPSQGEEISIPATLGAGTIVSVHCPNCGYKVPEELTRNLPVHYGDRILLLKYLYLIQEPKRWDVVVFKAPPKAGYAENYIKRLTGLPGETVMLLDGDVYTCPNEQYDALKDPADIASLPWKIQPKPRYVQERLWRVIYDNDFLPQNSPQRKKNAGEWVMPWKSSGSGWGEAPDKSVRPARILRFENMSGQGTLTFDKDANEGTFPFTDWLPYDEADGVTQYSHNAYGKNGKTMWYVSDLKLQFSYTRHRGDGALRAELTKLGHTFVAEFEPSVARLIHIHPDGRRNQIGKDVALSFAGKGPLRVELSNVDYRVTLRVNDRQVIQSDEKEFTPDIAYLIGAFHRDFIPRVGSFSESPGDPYARFIPSVRISAERQACEVAHLSLWRDIYYTPAGSGPMRGPPDSPVRLARRGERDAEGHTLDNEFFVLGDNSALSSDARDVRAWSKPVDLRADENLYTSAGRVPGRFMLGKAFFVYWPAGYRPISDSAPGVIPNFGEMRFIR